MKKHLFAFLLLCSFGLIQCGEANAPKIGADMRTQIDTTANKQMATLAQEMDTYCRDSSAMLVQRLTDSLIAVRQQEIMNVLPTH